MVLWWRCVLLPVLIGEEVRVKYYILLLIIHTGGINVLAALESKTKEANEVQKTGDMVNRALLSGDTANARLRVEGAQFKALNLYLPSFVLDDAVEKKTAALIREVIEKDLAISGSFNLIKKQANSKLESEALLKLKGAEGLSRCELSLKGQKIRAVLNHKNLLSSKKGYKRIEVDKSQVRRLAHLISQSIFEEYVGPEDIFLLQIAAVKRHK